jgi:hypothetical protein
MKINAVERPRRVFSLQRALGVAAAAPRAKRGFSLSRMRWLGTVPFRKRRSAAVAGDNTALWPTQKSEA